MRLTPREAEDSIFGELREPPPEEAWNEALIDVDSELSTVSQQPARAADFYARFMSGASPTPAEQQRLMILFGQTVGDSLSMPQLQSSSGLKITQEGSTFRTNVELRRGSQVDQGNAITGVTNGEVRQHGSKFYGKVDADQKSRIAQKNTINGQETPSRQS
ncbi:hypothetical protein FHL15_000334 [Xylaria flabelliformis]|uniref:Uncharacterized protein n=1 Tax=Xylaria flabelliformis TaxID=2512241 RepID=A0A553IFL5_9PEZI|nr:hypothetical protein FHL15_000334 [Xylaria flabelliformis]